MRIEEIKPSRRREGRILVKLEDGSILRLSEAQAAAFADAGEWDIPLAFDGVHFTEEGHRRFAARAEQAFRQAFGA